MVMSYVEEEEDDYRNLYYSYVLEYIYALSFYRELDPLL